MTKWSLKASWPCSTAELRQFVLLQHPDVRQVTCREVWSGSTFFCNRTQQARMWIALLSIPSLGYISRVVYCVMLRRQISFFILTLCHSNWTSWILFVCSIHGIPHFNQPRPAAPILFSCKSLHYNTVYLNMPLVSYLATFASSHTITPLHLPIYLSTP